MKQIVACLLLITAFGSCTNKPKGLSAEESASMVKVGDSIATGVQGILLQHVASAMQQSGTDYAIEFCNTKAMELTDSISGKTGMSIQRLSDRNRNPANALQSPIDSMAWARFTAGESPFVAQDQDGAVYYFKPIMIGMPTCLKCHGDKAEIAESTQQLLAQKYPSDKATGYRMGDLRGMWKIKTQD